jgi:hypothetical protein
MGNFKDPIPAYAGMTKYAYAGMTKSAYAGMTKYAYAGMTKPCLRGDDVFFSIVAAYCWVHMDFLAISLVH